MYPDPNWGPYGKSLYRPYIVEIYIYMGYNPNNRLHPVVPREFPFQALKISIPVDPFC